MLSNLHWFFTLLLLLVLGTFIYSLMILLLPIILPTKLIKNTSIHGVIFQNQIWQGTVRVDGDLITLPYVTTIIQPGTKIEVAIQGDKSNLDFLPWHLKSGINTGKAEHGVLKGEPFWDEKQKIQIHLAKLIALGSKDLPITLASEAKMGSPYDFNILSVKSGSLANIHLSNYRRFEIGSGVVVQDSLFDQIGECALCISQGSPTIVNNEFRDSSRENIWIESASPEISDNIFINNKGVAIRMQPKFYGSAKIFHNTFEMPEKVALESLSGDEQKGGEVSFNHFSGSSLIVIPCNSNLQFNFNNILGIISFPKGGCANSYTFGRNFWGTKERKVILLEKIINKEKRFQVLIPALEENPIKDAGRRKQ